MRIKCGANVEQMWGKWGANGGQMGANGSSERNLSCDRGQAHARSSCRPREGSKRDWGEMERRWSRALDEDGLLTPKERKWAAMMELGYDKFTASERSLG
ncbi:hypothetical protein M758_9G023600 [Ceratodon purpureus]|nr:hypothetical protein M758_9G023600 [Ceratodon purpureus]